MSPSRLPKSSTARRRHLLSCSPLFVPAMGWAALIGTALRRCLLIWAILLAPSPWASAVALQTVDEGSGGFVGNYTSMSVVAGNPATAYYDQSNRDLRFTRNSNADGTGSWTIVTVDSAGDVGQGASLAIVNGNPAIAYRDATNGHLKFARNSAADGSGSWTISTIDNSGNVGEHISMVVLNSNRPAVAYYDGINQDLRFALASSASGTGAWTLSTVSSSGDAGRFATLALLANGRPAIAFQGATGLSLARNAATDGSGGWSTAQILNGQLLGFSLAVIDGNPAVFAIYPFFIQENFSRTVYARNSAADGAGTWGVVDPGILLSSTAASLAEIAGLPAVAAGRNYYRAGSVSGSEPWTSTQMFTGSGIFISMKIINGNPAVTAARLEALLPEDRNLVYARSSNSTGSGAWTNAVIDDGSTSRGDVGQHASLQRVSGTPAIAYFDSLNGDLKFARNAAADGSGAWAISSPLTAGLVGNFSRMAIIAGNPAIGLYDATNARVAFVRNANSAGSGAWSVSGVESTPDSAGISIHDVSSAPALTYLTRATMANLRFSRNTAADGTGSWVANTVDTLGPSIPRATNYFSSLATVGGRPAVAYYHNADTALKFARNSAADGSGTWTLTVVDNAASVGQFASLAIVGGTPAISYYDATNTALKFARNSLANGEGSWTVTTVDDNGNTGEFTSLQVVDGFPTISYYDQSNGDLKLARNAAADGSGTWTITSLDTAGDVGRHTSLLALPGGYAVAYRDATNTSLKFAIDASCAGVQFPYTMTLATQAELVTAMLCANGNGPGADTINLNGLRVPLLAATPFADYSGQTALPQVTTNIVIRNGTLEHDNSAGGFLNRTFSVAASGTLGLENVSLLGEAAPTPGGAIHNSGTVNITNSTFTGYRTSNRAGVLHNASGSTANIANSLFYSNFAVFAHAIDNAGTVSIVNSTFDKHTSVSNFGSVLEGSGYTVRNSIVWNSPSSPVSIAAGNSVSNSVVKGGYVGGSNVLNLDPLFVNRTGNDFRLQASSPAINVGINADVPLDTTDVDGDNNTTEPRPDRDLNPRIVGAQVDLGAYERQTIAPSLSVGDISLSEGNTGTTQFDFTVSLSSPAPAGGVSFDIATSNGTATAGSDYQSRSLTGQSIAAGSSSYTFSVQVNGDRIQESNETFFVNVTNVAGATLLDAQGQGTIQNDDIAGITVTPTAGLITTEVGGTATFIVVLNSQPTADVTIGLSSSDTTEGTVSPSSLTFTAANWNTARTVTVTGVDDLIVDGNVAYTIVTAAATSADPAYAGVNAADVGVTNTDNDDLCTAYVFPYTLAGANNTVRVANLRQAIQCANLNGTADVIDLDAQTVTLSDSFASYTGATGLPEVSTTLTVRNGTLTRSGPTELRFWFVSAAGNLTLDNMVVTNGVGQAPGAVGGGGAVYTLGALNLVGSRFSSNSSLLDGGAIHVAGGAVNARNTIFSGNFTNIAGGGVGGAIANTDGVVTLTNVLISGNHAVQGAGVYNNSAGILTFNHVTIAGNLTNDQGAGLRNENTATSAVLNNTLISGNESTVFPALSNVGGAVTSNFSLVDGSPVFVAPLDASDTAPTTLGDYRLGNLSPAVDAGSDALSVLAVDLDGNPRRYDDTGVTDTGSGTAPIVDIGAFEKQTNSIPLQADLSITKTDGQTTDIPGTSISYTIVASNAGPLAVASATVVDTFPASITGVSWTCAGAGGGTCPASGSGNLNTTVGLPVGGSVSFTATGT
nr:hypothetical protein [Xanthomonadales bacterium]